MSPNLVIFAPAVDFGPKMTLKAIFLPVSLKNQAKRGSKEQNFGFLEKKNVLGRRSAQEWLRTDTKAP